MSAIRLPGCCLTIAICAVLVGCSTERQAGERWDLGHGPPDASAVSDGDTGVLIECENELEGDLTIETADDTRSFEENGYDCVSGTIRVVLQDDSSLSGLARLHTVGSLLVGQPPEFDTEDPPVNSGLVSLSGLGALRRVEGWLSFEHNPKLVDLSALGELHSVGGTLLFDGNPELESLDGLGALRAIGEDLVVTTNPVLSDIAALHEVRRVERNVEVVANSELSCAGAHALVDAIGRDNIGGEVMVSELGGERSCD